MDSNDGGVVLFDEFAAWVAAKKCPVDENVRSDFVRASTRMRRKQAAAPGSKVRKPASKFDGVQKRLFDIGE